MASWLMSHTHAGDSCWPIQQVGLGPPSQKSGAKPRHIHQRIVQCEGAPSSTCLNDRRRPLCANTRQQSEFSLRGHCGIDPPSPHPVATNMCPRHGTCTRRQEQQGDTHAALDHDHFGPSDWIDDQSPFRGRRSGPSGSRSFLRQDSIRCRTGFGLPCEVSRPLHTGVVPSWS